MNSPKHVGRGHGRTCFRNGRIARSMAHAVNLTRHAIISKVSESSVQISTGQAVTNQAPSSFASARQIPLRQLRERENLAKSTPAAQRAERLNGERDLSPLGGECSAGSSKQAKEETGSKCAESLQDIRVQRLRVFNAVMHIALNCTQNVEGARVYERLCAQNITKTQPTITAALKIYSRLGHHETVRQIWAEAKQSMKINEIMAAARIEAAAAHGDVETAARVLDEMSSAALSIDTLHVTSAIRACWEAKGHGHNAATFLFQLLLDSGLEPNIVTFTCLAGAYKSAPLKELVRARAEMASYDIQPDRVFAETYLASVLMLDPDVSFTMRSTQQLAEYIRPRPPERLRAAREELATLKTTDIDLTGLSLRIDKALHMLCVDD